MAWCFSTRASVATVLTTHPCVSRCLRVKGPPRPYWPWHMDLCPYQIMKRIVTRFKSWLLNWWWNEPVLSVFQVTSPMTWTTLCWLWATARWMDRSTGLSRTPGPPTGAMMATSSCLRKTTTVGLPRQPHMSSCRTTTYENHPWSDTRCQSSVSI